MKLYNAIKNYIPFNAQEAEDKVRILKFIEENPDFLYRENLEGHMTTSIWNIVLYETYLPIKTFNQINHIIV